MRNLPLKGASRNLTQWLSHIVQIHCSDLKVNNAHLPGFSVSSYKGGNKVYHTEKNRCCTRKQCCNNYLNFLYTLKPMVVSLRAQRITVQMFYFRLTVDPDVLVWVHAIFFFLYFLLLEVVLIFSRLGKKLVLIGWMDSKNTLKTF